MGPAQAPLDRILLVLAAVITIVCGTLAASARASDFGCFVEAPGSPLEIGGSPNSIDLAELDGDRYHDLILTDRARGRIFVAHGQKGGFGRPLGHRTGGRGSLDAVARDLGGDGRVEIAAVSRGTFQVSVLTPRRGDREGFSLRRIALGSSFGHPTDLEIADLDRDGALDLVVGLGSDTEDGGAVSVLLGRANGGFGAALANRASGARIRTDAGPDRRRPPSGRRCRPPRCQHGLGAARRGARYARRAATVSRGRPRRGGHRSRPRGLRRA